MMEGMFSRLKTKVLSAVNLDISSIPAVHTNQHSNSIGTSASESSLLSTASASASSSLSQSVAAAAAAAASSHRHHTDNRSLPNKFTYNRPIFLQLVTQDELRASADHNVRPIIVPRDISIMPWSCGYAECVNSGKSEWNEDQAAFYRQILTHPTDKDEPGLPYTYFGIFDGHAGYGAALAASHQFHHILHEKLVDVIDLLVTTGNQQSGGVKGSKSIDNIPYPMAFYRNISKHELIVGALESAFLEMDALLAGDRKKYRNAGGCTALVTLFIDGWMFVANAGDSRSILCQRLLQATESQSSSSSSSSLSSSVLAAATTMNGSSTNHCSADDKTTTSNSIKNGNAEHDQKNWQIIAKPFSYDHTPETERPRLMTTAQLNPHLMGGAYVATEYAKRPMQRDLGKRVLYRHGSMVGWAYKTLTYDDLQIPIVTGEGKRSRLMGTIGVTRGFGDHDLKALCTGLSIKPFLSPHPEVISRDLSKIVYNSEDNNEDGVYGILIMATDGLWDVLDTETVSKTVFNTLNKYPVEKHRYTMVAQELVAKSRGRCNESNHWRLAESKAAATVDDISVLVIPVYQYYKEYIEWKAGYLHRKQNLNLDSKLPEEHKGEFNEMDKNGGNFNASFNSMSVKNCDDGICEGEEAHTAEMTAAAVAIVAADIDINLNNESVEATSTLPFRTDKNAENILNGKSVSNRDKPI